MHRSVGPQQDAHCDGDQDPQDRRDEAPPPGRDLLVHRQEGEEPRQGDPQFQSAAHRDELADQQGEGERKADAQGHRSRSQPVSDSRADEHPDNRALDPVPARRYRLSGGVSQRDGVGDHSPTLRLQRHLHHNVCRHDYRCTDDHPCEVAQPRRPWPGRCPQGVQCHVGSVAAVLRGGGLFRKTRPYGGWLMVDPRNGLRAGVRG